MSHPRRIGEHRLTVAQEERRMARFAQYAIAAAEEALEDAGWKPSARERREATVRPHSQAGLQVHRYSDFAREFAWAPA